jgi:peptidoglycan/xylan/chitin deacetylase (PgdA/CDA1 family)
MSGRSSRRNFLGLTLAAGAAVASRRAWQAAADGDAPMPYDPERMDLGREARVAGAAVAGRTFRAVAPGISYDVAPAPPSPPPPPPDLRFEVPRVFYRGDPAGDAAYLTIDDCYSGPMVTQALELAARFGAKLTFFPVGQDIERMPSLWRDVDARGHAIENHTYAHRSFLRQSVPEIIDAIARQRWAVEAALGRACTQYFVRPPGGDGIAPPNVDARLPALGASLSLKFAGWSADSNGWRYGARTDAATVRTVAANALAGFGPGSIVLFHSIPVDMAALEIVLQAARDRGLRCISMREGLR